MAYPPRHIEVDNRLAWFLGYLQEHHGHEAYYVHLTRDRDAVALGAEGDLASSIKEWQTTHNKSAGK